MPLVNPPSTLPEHLQLLVDLSREVAGSKNHLNFAPIGNEDAEIPKNDREFLDSIQNRIEKTYKQKLRLPLLRLVYKETHIDSATSPQFRFWLKGWLETLAILGGVFPSYTDLDFKEASEVIGRWPLKFASLRHAARKEDLTSVISHLSRLRLEFIIHSHIGSSCKWKKRLTDLRGTDGVIVAGKHYISAHHAVIESVRSTFNKLIMTGCDPREFAEILEQYPSDGFTEKLLNSKCIDDMKSNWQATCFESL